MRFWICFSLLLACGLPVTAQIVNIEDKRQQVDTTGWYGQLDLGFNLTQNSSRILSLNSAVRLDRLEERQNWLIYGGYNRVSVNGNDFINTGFGHLRYDRDLSGALVWEAFTQLQSDEKLQLNLRWLAGTGPRLRLSEEESFRLYAGLLYMYEYDRFSGDIVYRDHRLSSYLSLRLQWNDRVSLANTTYYQPKLPDFSLPRITTATSLAVQLASWLSFTSRFNLTYDRRLSEDFEGIPLSTYSWLNGIRLLIGRG